MSAPNPVIRETALRAFPGWTVRQYADGTHDAAHRNGVSITRGFESFAAVIAELHAMRDEFETADRRFYGGA